MIIPDKLVMYQPGDAWNHTGFLARSGPAYSRSVGADHFGDIET
jgi:hypothetical protein